MPDTTTTDEQPDGRQVVPFATVIQHVRKGAALDELAVKLDELFVAVQGLGKAGKLTVTVEVKPIDKGAGDRVDVVVTSTAQLPKVKTPGTMFFLDRKGHPHTEDPTQEAVFSRRAVEEAQTVTRVVTAR